FATVATLGSLLLHVTFWLVALSGSTVAVRVAVLPVNSSRVSVFSFTPVTRIGAGLIVSVNSLLSLPLPLLVAVTVKVEEPTALGVPVIVPALFSVRPSG